MKLANQDQLQALDPEFGRMATEVGAHAWSLPQLTMREKTFVFLAADLCSANVGFRRLLMSKWRTRTAFQLLNVSPPSAI